MTNVQSPASERHRVVVVGSGFGGLFSTKALKHADVDVTMIGKTTHHLFQPLLYQVATGILSEGEIAPPTREVLSGQKNARVILGKVNDIDLAARTVTSNVLNRTVVTPYDSLRGSGTANRYRLRYYQKSRSTAVLAGRPRARQDGGRSQIYRQAAAHRHSRAVRPFCSFSLPSFICCRAIRPPLCWASMQRPHALRRNAQLSFGLDDPLIVRSLGRYILGLLHGDFGRSLINNRPVLAEYLSPLSRHARIDGHGNAVCRNGGRTAQAGCRPPPRRASL